MTVNFPLILASLTLFTGMIVLVDYIIVQWHNRHGKRHREKTPITIEYARAFFPVLLIVFAIRSFIIQPYRVPTGSLEPTVLPGDFILVNQYQYGLRIPIWDAKFMPVGEPKTGQIALFYYPVNKRITFVKRVIGVPGDKISYVNKVLYINGKKATQKFIKNAVDRSEDGMKYRVAVYEENLSGVKHKIFVRPDKRGLNFYNLVVPKGKYFMMGDNRDSSDDSRYWGFVDGSDLIGRALLVWMSWNSFTNNWFHKIRWDRIGVML